MKYLRKFNSIAEMEAALIADKVSFIGMVQPEGQEPEMAVHTHIPILPSNLTITCINNIITITATDADIIQYSTTSSSGPWTTYTTPFEINNTVTIYAKASTSDGEINCSQECVYVDIYGTPFYIENISNEDGTVTIRLTDANNVSAITVQKSSNGTDWTSMGTTSTTGITATVPANGRLYLKSKASTWAAMGTRMVAYHYITCDKQHIVGGNINSLLNSAGLKELYSKTKDYALCSLFSNDTNLVSAYNLVLPATTTLTKHCYQHMFSGCTSLTTPPPTLPATTLTEYCYYGMFSGCTSLTTVPTLPATTMANWCYASMFDNCTSLTTVHTSLPATTLADSCYQSMYQNCSSLTAAPTLPNETLTTSCYSSMFYGCSSLTTAPVLPATTLTNSCYYRMFGECTNLNYIKCLATNKSASNCTAYWVSNVAATGTFIKDPNMSTSTWGTGANGIPSGWTVEDNS